MSETIRRISVEEGVALFERTGLKPMPGAYYQIVDGQSCSCLVGALVIDTDGREAAETALRERRLWCASGRALSLGLDGAYLRGLINGFDAGPQAEPEEIFSGISAYVLGFKDGVAVRSHISPTTEGGTAC